MDAGGSTGVVPGRSFYFSAATYTNKPSVASKAFT